MALTDKVKETALEIRGQVLDFFKKFSKGNKWPPMPKSLPDLQILMPVSLQNFVQVLTSGSVQVHLEKTSRLMYSIS